VAAALSVTVDTPTLSQKARKGRAPSKVVVGAKGWATRQQTSMETSWGRAGKSRLTGQKAIRGSAPTTRLSVRGPDQLNTVTPNKDNATSIPLTRRE
jgi:hypothetical protein